MAGWQSVEFRERNSLGYCMKLKVIRHFCARLHLLKRCIKTGSRWVGVGGVQRASYLRGFNSIII